MNERLCFLRTGELWPAGVWRLPCKAGTVSACLATVAAPHSIIQPPTCTFLGGRKGAWLDFTFSLGGRKEGNCFFFKSGGRLVVVIACSEAEVGLEVWIRRGLNVSSVLELCWIYTSSTRTVVLVGFWGDWISSCLFCAERLLTSVCWFCWFGKTTNLRQQLARFCVRIGSCAYLLGIEHFHGIKSET